MNTFTHLGISHRLMHAVEKELKVNLDTAGFILGNIKPDISSRLIQIPHYKKDSIGFIRKEIGYLLGLKLNKCTRLFSERLGIITHYLSDFFCHAHSENFKGGLLEHYLYEIQLSGYCNINYNAITGFNYGKNAVVNRESFSICAYIDELHEEYCRESNVPSFELDMYYTLKACTSICFSIIYICIACENSIINAA